MLNKTYSSGSLLKEVVNLYHKITYKLFQQKKYGWFGDYETWQDALNDSTGYNTNEIFEKVSHAALKVKTGEAVYERDSVVFDEIQYSWPLLACLMYISVRNKGHLNILDFGGSLGSTYFQNRLFLNGLSSVRWNIVEQPQFVDFGRTYLQDDHLHFFKSFNECLESLQPSAILLSSVLPYLEKPAELLHEVIQIIGFEYIIIDRTGLIPGNKDRLTVQKVPPGIYEASYPCWFYSKENFSSQFENSYQKIVEWGALGKANIESEFKGMLFQRLSI